MSFFFLLTFLALLPPSLADNSIGNLGAKALSRALLVNRTLTALE